MVAYRQVRENPFQRKKAIDMSILIEVMVAAIVVLGAVAGRALLMNLEDDAFDAELTAAANEAARRMQGMSLQEMNA